MSRDFHLALQRSIQYHIFYTDFLFDFLKFTVVEKKEKNELLLKDLIPPIDNEIAVKIKNADFPQNETKIEINQIQEQSTITITAAVTPQAINVKEAK